MSRYNGAVNGYFLCDRGRFGYEFVNNERRVKTAQIRSNKESTQKPVEDEKLSLHLNQIFSKNRNICGIGSPRATLESNFALMSLVGKENFYHGISKKEFALNQKVTDYLQHSGVHTPSLKEIEKADVVLILGEDLVNTAPMIALAVRQAARNVPNEQATKNHIPLWNDIPVRQLGQNEMSPLFIATTSDDSLDEIAGKTFRASYADIASLGNAIAGNFDVNAPDAKTEKKDIKSLADEITSSLKKAKNPLIISGISCNDEGILNAALNLTNALLISETKVMLSLVVPECNSIGLSLFPGKSFEEIENKEIDTLVVLENDLYRRTDSNFVDNLFKKTSQVVVIDQIVNQTTQRADVLLPAATFAESEGTLVNNEGRAQRYYKAIEDKSQIKESWRWIEDLLKIRNAKTNSWVRLDDIIDSMVIELPFFLKLKKYMPDADFRMLNTKIPRQTMRYSGRTAMNANIVVSEQKLPQDPDSPLSFTMEGQPEKPPSSLVPFYWTPGWNSVQAMYNYVDEPDASMKGGDPGIKLFESGAAFDRKYFNQETKPLEIKKGEWLIVPLYQIFGSEELSSVSSSILQKVSEPFVLINQSDADNLQVKDEDLVQLKILNSEYKVKIRIRSSIQTGMAALSVNLPGMNYIDLPGTGKFHKL
jgi:NADH-quinone oxidoreductase subunit G